MKPRADMYVYVPICKYMCPFIDGFIKVCAAGKAARLVHAVAYVVMRECTRRSRLAGSAGEAAEELYSRQMRVQVWERKQFATAGYNQRFIYSVFTKDAIDDQARDTRVLVTL